MRLTVAVVCVPALFSLLLPWWITVETAMVGQALGGLGVDATRTGTELMLRNGGDPVVLVLVSWCSSLGAVLGLTALACLVPGTSRGRRRALAVALAIVVFGNLVRLTAVGWVASTWAPSRVDAFHDGPATAFAVVAFLIAVGVIALRAPRRCVEPSR